MLDPSQPPATMTRRGVLGLGLATTAAALTACAASPGTPAPPPTSVDASALSADLRAVLHRHLRPTAANPDHPAYAGAVALVTIGGQPVAGAVAGEALRYGPGAVLLPPDRRVAMGPDAIFDLASLTKVVTAIVLLRLVDRGEVDLDAPVRHYLPEFTAPSVLVRHLLTHTSGLPVGPALAGSSTVEQRWRAVLATPLLPSATPGTEYRYSGLGLMLAGLIVQRRTGLPFDQAVRSELTDPLGLHETGFRPTSWLSPADQARLVATDAVSPRGLLRGVVHDDICELLGGVAGHAGLFSTATEVAAIGAVLLAGGAGVLSPATVARMLSNANAGLPAYDPDGLGRTADHGLGVALGQRWFMGGLTTPDSFGHTGFTGTSIVCVPRHDLVLVLLTNRAHPSWRWSDPNPVRVEVADAVARHLAG